MKKLFVLLIVCWGCGAKLSDEERKKLHEGMSTQDIKKVSEGELQEAALTYGQSVVTDVERIDKYLNQQAKIDSIGFARHVKIYSLVPDDGELRDIEKKLVEAYITGANAGPIGDNLQKAGEDSLLFTRPVFKDRPDGSQEFSHAIGIKMAKKTVVLSMPKP